MIAHPLTVTSPAEGETAFFNFSFSHLYPLLEFRIADFGNPNNSILESVTLKSLKADESPAWESASVNVKLTSPDEGYLTLTPGGAPQTITLSVTGDEAARVIPPSPQKVSGPTPHWHPMPRRSPERSSSPAMAIPAPAT